MTAITMTERMVLQSLRYGPSTALDIRLGAGLSHEAVYQALASLEAKSAVSIWTRSRQRDNTWQLA